MVIGFPYARRLLEFYQASGRSLPWRGERDLYRLWVSEVMLQQTGVTTVIPYYHRFLQRFPTLAALGAASLQEVLALWQGLGYYRRARLMHQAAQKLHEAGVGLPETLEGWMSLSGVGQSTACAILAIGRDQPHAILDGNVQRVLSRVLAMEECVDGGGGRKRLWEVARAWTSREQPGDYAQAIMDLGATLCIPKNPQCSQCPWQEGCLAWSLGRVEDYPKKKAKKPRPRLFQTAVLVREERGGVLLNQRPEKGLLAGLWEPLSDLLYPAREDGIKGEGVVSWLDDRWGVRAEDGLWLGEVQHPFTHFHLTVEVYTCSYREGWPRGVEAKWWFGRGVPVSTLHRKILMLRDVDLIG